MSPLYAGNVVDDEKPEKHPIRSTEFIYRSWDEMQRWRAPAQAAFLAEVQSIRAGKKGANQQQIAAELLSGFIPLVGTTKPNDTGSFTMGAPPDEDPDRDQVQGKQDNPQHPVTLSPFHLHRFCVTNLEYELFDLRHRDDRWYYSGEHPAAVEKPGADDRCPVVMVSWYDAWCFTRWLGGLSSEKNRASDLRITLPSEAQWEYTCRAGLITPFTFQDSHDGLTCTADVCNFDGRYPFGNGAEKGEYRERTVPVDELPANRWGFAQMHGNVREWCLDWYGPDFYESQHLLSKDPVNRAKASARVLRGGCWIFDGRLCRSASRSRNVAVSRFRFCGFRLAAVPASLEPSK